MGSLRACFCFFSFFLFSVFVLVVFSELCGRLGGVATLISVAVADF